MATDESIALRILQETDPSIKQKLSSIRESFVEVKRAESVIATSRVTAKFAKNEDNCLETALMNYLKSNGRSHEEANAVVDTIFPRVTAVG